MTNGTPTPNTNGSADGGLSLPPNTVLNRRANLEIPKGRFVRGTGRDGDLATFAETKYVARQVEVALREELVQVGVAAGKDLQALKAAAARGFDVAHREVESLRALIESRTLRGRWRRFVAWVQRLNIRALPVDSVGTAPFDDTKPGETPA